MWARGASPFELPHQTSQLLLQPHNTLQRGAGAKLHLQHSDPLTGDNYAMTDSFHCCATLAWSHKLHVTTWCSVLRVACCLWEAGQLLKLQLTERDKSPAKLTENPLDLHTPLPSVWRQEMASNFWLNGTIMTSFQTFYTNITHYKRTFAFWQNQVPSVWHSHLFPFGSATLQASSFWTLGHKCMQEITYFQSQGRGNDQARSSYVRKEEVRYQWCTMRLTVVQWNLMPNYLLMPTYFSP